VYKSTEAFCEAEQTLLLLFWKRRNAQPSVVSEGFFLKSSPAVVEFCCSMGLVLCRADILVLKRTAQ
jgi:hypothetical protein